MQVLFNCCCGIDVHAKMLVASLFFQGKKEIRTFSTMRDDLVLLSDWLTASGCTHVAIESTGVYCKPVFNILEGNIEVMLVNARDAKGYKARKSDVIDAEWLADLLRHALLKPSFIPPSHIRELRELTRYRQSLVRRQTALSNRIIKLVESANIKLSQVASDALGLSGKLMLRALSQGQTDPQLISDLARGRLISKKDQLKRALVGRLTEAKRWIVSQLLDLYDQIEKAIDEVELRIHKEVENSPDPFVEEAITLLDTIPGIDIILAWVINSEMGVDMSQLPEDKNLTSWAGICPGNNESAGKRKTGKTAKGNKYLRAALIQAAWAATHQKQSYLAAQYRRLVRRMGKKKALVAVAHSILVICNHVLKNREGYKEMGGDYFERRDVSRQRKRLIHQLESLGLKVTVEEVEKAA